MFKKFGEMFVFAPPDPPTLRKGPPGDRVPFPLFFADSPGARSKTANR